MNFECPICNELGDARGDVAGASNGLCMIANCGHVFHRKCLDQWQIRSANCPSCRQPCHKVWPLFGATKVMEPTPRPRVTTSVSGTDYEELNNLYTSLEEVVPETKKEDHSLCKCCFILKMYLGLRQDYREMQQQLEKARSEVKEKAKKCSLLDLKILQLKCELQMSQLGITSPI